ncbi:probable serine/threonine-protein kinase DDB_G0267686 [Hydractinia symbiolongicarpus]|uniref:probable serine/threonine-protein kinase DDB_G0267686 n=1 Tax=Hydractinia symbiolongicarpus TaxID=13093 RepID=UPI0025504B1D|nr:probable serine/threonine-protein kinase DDB_G0267686 [Hydractinia symbiolongicarpus]
MPRGRSYVNNAMNRSLGRVGMAMGSAPVSAGSSSAYSSFSARAYVDNSANRSLGRVGMPLGSAPVSRSFDSGGSRIQSSSSHRTYVDNAPNRNLGRVGMTLGSAPVSRSSNSGGSHRQISSSHRTYVDNAPNRNLGRVGMPLGSAPVSRSSDSGGSHKQSSSSHRTYVDNAPNRNLGRVGMPLGSAPVSSDSGVSHRKSSSQTYVDNAANRSLGRAGKPLGSVPVSKSQNSSKNSASTSVPRTYADNRMNQLLNRVGKPLGSVPVYSFHAKKSYVNNSLNRKLNRVGMPVGSKPVSKTSMAKSNGDPRSLKKVYVDNAANRKLNRVGLPLGTKPVSSKKSSDNQDLKMAYHQLANNPHEDFNENDIPYRDDILELLELCASRMAAWENLCQDHAQEDVPSLPSLMERFQGTNIHSGHPVESYPVHTTSKIDPPFLTNQDVASYFGQQPIYHIRNVATEGRPSFSQYKGTVIDFNEITLENKVGQGGFGEVYAGKWLSRRVAIKILRVQRVSKKRQAQFEGEIKIFNELFHKNIVTFYGACIKTPNLCMVMELMQDSLFDMLHVKEHQFDEAQKYFIAQEIACGLSYLHSQNVAHADMKPSNVLLNTFQDDIACVKITDFGLSIMKSESETSTSVGKQVGNIGTPKYMAPEILRGEFIGRDELKLVDIYSFGLIIFELFSEEIPFEDLNINQLRKQVGEGRLVPEVAELKIDSGIVTIMEECWLRQPNKRPSAEKCYNVLATKINKL